MPVAGQGAWGSGRLPGQSGRARITVRPGARQIRGRTPFAVLVVALLTAGLLGLLTLNTALNENSFELSRLKRQTTELTDRKQSLQHEIDQYSAPDALERRARELGMVSGGDPAFLKDDGSVLGKPAQAQDGPPVKRTDNGLWQQPGAAAQPATPQPSPGPSAPPTGQPPAQPTPPAAADGGVEIAPLPPATGSAAPSVPAGGTPR
ncbi:septum formation initiator family protein [Kitasatospora sp. NPDC094015]|uniref:FtsB family cell division protein n=1 Tax=Kitasatospora sp. NPDC094015 TaxID=3155205 RepID=UPI003327362B